VGPGVGGREVSSLRTLLPKLDVFQERHIGPKDAEKADMLDYLKLEVIRKYITNVGLSGIKYYIFFKGIYIF